MRYALGLRTSRIAVPTLCRLRRGPASEDRLAPARSHVHDQAARRESLACRSQTSQHAPGSARTIEEILKAKKDPKLAIHYLQR
jgi:hypothetical protein